MGISHVLGQITVEPVLFSYMLCIFLTFPLLQQLAYEKICQDDFGAEACSNLTKEHADTVHKKTSQWILYQSIAYTIPSIISSLVLGSWSDRVGRKLTLVLPLVGTILQGISNMLNVGFMSLNVNFLIIGVGLGGCFGGFATLLLAVFSYIADITDKSQRTLRVGILEAMIFLGGTIGELVGGVLVDHSGYMAAFGLAVGVNGLAIIYVCFVLRESFLPQEIHGENWALVAIHNHLKNVFGALVKLRPQGNRLTLFVLCGSFSIVILTFTGFTDVAILYSKLSPRNFSPSLIGYFLATHSVFKGIGIMVGLPILTKVFRLSDYTIAIIGVLSNMAAAVYLGFANTKWMMFLAPVIGIGSGLPPPCIRSHISKVVEPQEQGIIFGAVASFEVLSTLLASVIFNSVYSKTVDWMASFCFFLMAVLLLIPISLLIWMYMRDKNRNPYHAMETEQTTLPPPPPQMDGDLKTADEDSHLTRDTSVVQA